VTQQRRFAGIYVATCAGALALALIVNLLGNVNNGFPSPFFPAFSERAWKTRRLDDAVRESRPPKILILGSSRVMQIEPKYVQAITGKTTFNYGVSTATPADFLAQLRYLLSIGCRPETLLVGVEERSFHHPSRSWEMETLGHLRLFMKMPFPENLDILIGSLRGISLRSTARSLERLVGMNRSARRIEDVDQLLLEDGYLIYCNHVRETANGTFNQAVNIAESVGREDGAAELRESVLRPDPRQLALFEEFLTLSRAEGIEVRVMFLPMHPDFERQRFTGQLSRARSAMGRNLQRICTEYDATYLDFTDLASYGGDPREFYDTIHQTPINTRRMMNVLFGIRARDDVATHLPTDSDILKHLPPVTTLTPE
jgi:hypothetical protein